MKKSLRILVGIGMLALLIVGYVVLCNREMSNTKPADGVKTITEFHDVMDSAGTVPLSPRRCRCRFTWLL